MTTESLLRVREVGKKQQEERGGLADLGEGLEMLFETRGEEAIPHVVQAIFKQKEYSMMIVYLLFNDLNTNQAYKGLYKHRRRK